MRSTAFAAAPLWDRPPRPGSHNGPPSHGSPHTTQSGWPERQRLSVGAPQRHLGGEAPQHHLGGEAPQRHLGGEAPPSTRRAAPVADLHPPAEAPVSFLTSP